MASFRAGRGDEEVVGVVAWSMLYRAVVHTHNRHMLLTCLPSTFSSLQNPTATEDVLWPLVPGTDHPGTGTPAGLDPRLCEPLRPLHLRLG